MTCEYELTDCLYKLNECQSEVARHHDAFIRASELIEQINDELKSFEGDDPHLRVGAATALVRQLRNVIPPPS